MLTLLVALSLASPPTEKGTVPAEFVRDRIFVTADAGGERPIRFFTDTGGGWNQVKASVAEALALSRLGEVESDGGGRHSLVEYPKSLESAGVPRPANEPWLRGGLVVVPDESLDHDGVLGSRWFADRVWFIDYPASTMRVLTDWKVPAAYGRAPLGFRKGKDGIRDLNFPRITATIGGQDVEMLLDTGATAELTAEAAPHFSLAPSTEIGISYIARSIFEDLAADNPSWRVIERGDQVTGKSFPMIEVPTISIAGVELGPVWFAQRPDDTFRKWISQMMDKQVEGAIGGSALKYVQVVIDYPGSTAYLLKTKPRVE